MSVRVGNFFLNICKLRNDLEESKGKKKINKFPPFFPDKEKRDKNVNNFFLHPFFGTMKRWI